MKKELYQIVEDVESEQDFLNFLEALMLDREDEEKKEKDNPSSPYGAGANGWENGNIVSFLEAASAWGEASINGFELYKKPDNPWNRAAQILHAGKFYE